MERAGSRSAVPLGLDGPVPRDAHLPGRRELGRPRLRHHRHHPTVAPHSSGRLFRLRLNGTFQRDEAMQARAVRCRRRPALHLRHPRGAYRRRFPLRHGHGLHVAGEVPARRVPRDGLPRTDVGAEDGVRSGGRTLRESLTESDVLGTSAPGHRSKCRTRPAHSGPSALTIPWWGVLARGPGYWCLPRRLSAATPDSLQCSSTATSSQVPS